jgi:hypothetical protein
LRFRHCRSLLVGNGIGFRPLGKVVHSDRGVSVSLVAPWDWPCYMTAILSNGAPTLY